MKFVNNLHINKIANQMKFVTHLDGYFGLFNLCRLALPPVTGFLGADVGHLVGAVFGSTHSAVEMADLTVSKARSPLFDDVKTVDAETVTTHQHTPLYWTEKLH
jgi:hypothetical protein